jgi:uncharacterized protein (TIGR03437 family)
MRDFVPALLLLSIALPGQAQSERALAWLLGQVNANTSTFFIYRDHDDGRNAATASGLFPAGVRLSVDPACIDDPDSATGCATDSRRLDCEKGTVLRLTWPPMASYEYAGLNLEEPEGYTTRARGIGYDLRPGTHLVFRYRSPTGISVRFGINPGGTAAQTPFQRLPASRSWSEMRIPIAELRPALTDLRDVHIPFFVVSNGDPAEGSPAGGTLLLDDIRIEPVPSRRQTMAALPLAFRTCGVIPAPDALPGRVPIPPDQLVRNVATVYESSLVLWALLRDGSAASRAAARQIADTFVAVHARDNSGLPLPKTKGGAGLRNAYMNGPATFLNDQTGGARAGEARLAGFSIASERCGPSRFCLVLDGATGGNNAFAVIALLAAWRQLGDVRYLEAARSLATWIYEALLDASEESFGGYFAGFQDGGAPDRRLTSKSVENNADIAAAFWMLADVESEHCRRGEAEQWKRRARVAGDFVMRMFDARTGRFFAGTAPPGASGPGLRLDGKRRGQDVINTFDFLDANTFIPLALMSLPDYRDAIDWRKPVDWALRQSQRIRAGGREFEGYSLVAQPVAGPRGIAWEFTAQLAVAMRAVDAHYGERRYAERIAALLEEIRRAQAYAPFAEGGGIPAATLENGEQIPPYEACLSTPFQCIPQRPGLAATAWAIFAERGWNPLGREAIQFDLLPRVVNAASFDGCVAPGSLISLFRWPLAGRWEVASGFPLPEELAGARLELDRRPLPLLYAGLGQINAQLPYESPTGRLELELVLPGGSRVPAPVEVRPAAPGIFLRDPVRCVAFHAEGIPVDETTPATPRGVVTVFLTGVGPASPPVATGAPAPLLPLAVVRAPAVFTVGGLEARLLFFGLTPGTAGVAQANLELPAGLAAGEQEVAALVDGFPSNVCRIPVAAGSPGAPAPRWPALR